MDELLETAKSRVTCQLAVEEKERGIGSGDNV